MMEIAHYFSVDIKWKMILRFVVHMHDSKYIVRLPEVEAA